MVLGLFCFSLPSWFSSCFIWAIASPHILCLPLFVFPPVRLPPRLDCLQLCSVPSCVSLCNQSRVVSSFPLWRDVFAPCACLCIPLSSIFHWVSVSCSLIWLFYFNGFVSDLITVQTLLQGWSCVWWLVMVLEQQILSFTEKFGWMVPKKQNSLLFLVLDGKH